MNKNKVEQLTSSYEEWLINSLKNKKEATAYLQVALDEYRKDGDTEALLLALRNISLA